MNSKFLMYPLVVAVSLSIVGILNAGKKPEEQSGYDKTKDVGLKAPKGAEVLFDGTMKSVKNELGDVAKKGHGYHLENNG